MNNISYIPNALRIQYNVLCIRYLGGVCYKICHIIWSIKTEMICFANACIKAYITEHDVMPIQHFLWQMLLQLKWLRCVTLHQRVTISVVRPCSATCRFQIWIEITCINCVNSYILASRITQYLYTGHNRALSFHSYALLSYPWIRLNPSQCSAYHVTPTGDLSNYAE